MTFEEFLLSCAKREDGTYLYGYDVNRPMNFMCLGTTPQLLQKVWNAAIEAAATKLARGTNLYNICGDHISGQVIDSITQLKSS